MTLNGSMSISKSQFVLKSLSLCTCQACKKCSGNCKDEKKDCGTWANKGFCKSGKFVDYMKLRCKKSCKVC